MSILHLPPELTIYTVAELHPQWMSWCAGSATPGTDSVALEIGAVDEVDAAGLQLLLSMTQMLTARGTAVELRGTSGALQTGLAALGLDHAVGRPSAAAIDAAGASA